MGHSLLFVLVPAGETYEKRSDEEGFDYNNVLAVHSGFNVEGEYQRFRLDAEPDPEANSFPLVRWKMTHRQARLELHSFSDPNNSNDELTPDMPLERLVDLLMGRREYVRERYWIEGNLICGESPAHPFPKTDGWELGGYWTQEFANPPPWERQEVFRDCYECDGVGRLKPRSYILPRFMRLTAGARADRGEAEICPVCNGEKGMMALELVENPPDSDFLKTIPEVLKLMEWDDHCWPWAIVDLDGLWHGTEGGHGYGVPGELSEREWLENGILPHLHEAPAGTKVLVLDAHM